MTTKRPPQPPSPPATAPGSGSGGSPATPKGRRAAHSAALRQGKAQKPPKAPSRRSVWRKEMLARQRVFPLAGIDVVGEPLVARLRREHGSFLAPFSRFVPAERRAREAAEAPVCQDLFAWAAARDVVAPAPRPSRATVRLGLRRQGPTADAGGAGSSTPARDYGGPDPSAPCVGCPKRARCKAPCDLLAAALPPEEVDHRREVRSSVLSEPGRQDGGHDEGFITIPDEWAGDLANVHSREGTTGRWEAFTEAHGGERLRELVASPLVLTRPQRTVVEQMLLGRERVEIRVARSTSRQSVHKVVHAALDALGLAFAVDAWREIEARVGRDAVDEALADDDVARFAAERIARAARPRSGEAAGPGRRAPVDRADVERARELLRAAAAHLGRSPGAYRVCGTTKAMREGIYALVAALEDHFGRA